MVKFIFAFLILASQTCFSQVSGWTWQNPLPQGDNLDGLQFVNSTTAFCFSYNHLLKSVNAGATWQMVPTGQTQDNISMYFADANTGYILCDSGKVLKTTDSGNSWFLASNIQSASRFIYFKNSVTGYALADYIPWSEYGAKLYRTTNGASSWSLIIADPNMYLGSIYFPQNDTGYAIGYYGQYSATAKVMKSVNGGISWDSLPQTFQCWSTNSYFYNTKIGYIFGYRWTNKIYKTINGGVNWTQQLVTNGDPSNLFFFDQYNGIGSSNQSEIIKTSNGGANWDSVAIVKESGYGIYSMKFLNPSTGYFVGLGGRIMKSVNGGVNWSFISNGQHIDITSTKFLSAGLAYAVGNYTMLKSTDAGLSWFSLTNDSASLFPYHCLDFINENTGFVAGNNFLRKTTNGGANWQNMNLYGLNNFTDIYFPSANSGYLICNNGNILKTTDAGISWGYISSPGFYSNNTAFLFIYFINDLTGFTGGGEALFGVVSKTTDGGLSWDTTRTNNSERIFDMVFINPNTGFAACEGCEFSGDAGIMKSTDGGNTWVTKAYGGCFSSISFPNQRKIIFPNG